MATYVLSRSDLFPVGTTVGAYLIGNPALGYDGPPPGAAVESQAVGAGGSATFTTLAADTPYTFAANVGGSWQKLRARVSVSPPARATGTGDTSSGTNTVLNAAATVGAFAVGQRLTGPGVPAGTFVTRVVGSTLTLSDKATATATGVALEGHGSTRWRARVMQRRDAVGTS